MQKFEISRRAILIAGFGMAASSRGYAQAAFKLVMVEEAGCVYCARWHAEVGQAYANSAEGKFAPLERVSIGDASVNYLTGLRYTPTFVLVEGRREIGRITGYPGADFFWGLLAQLLAKTSYAAPASDEIKT